MRKIIDKKKKAPIDGSLDALRQSHPPQCILIIGAGDGKGHSAWSCMLNGQPDLPAIFVEADGRACDSLQDFAARRKGGRCVHALVSNADGEAVYNKATISSESGLVPIGLLSHVWPNIQQTASEPRKTRSINSMLAEMGVAPNWLWVDCLPSLRIFEGSAPPAKRFNVVCLRVLIDECEDLQGKELCLPHVRQVMNRYGYDLVTLEEERNPLIGLALFAKRKRETMQEPIAVHAIPAIVPHDSGSESKTIKPAIGTASKRIKKSIESTISSQDVTGSVSKVIKNSGFNPNDTYHYLLGVSNAARAAGDNMLADGLLNEISHRLDKLPTTYSWHLIDRLVELNLVDDAYELLLRGIARDSPLRPAIAEKLVDTSRRWMQKLMDKRGHGHEVLIAYLTRHADLFRNTAGKEKPVIIEIGTTRENASGQGSTRRLMEFCEKESFHLITVDMDPANAELADAMFRQHGNEFEAVHSKGEDYLASYKGRMDCVFLDAYDYDHGKHSERRQSRYVKYLGARIDEKKCHKMHLDCARLVAGRMSECGVICVDDTWIHDGKWMAKGTLAMPFLLKSGMILLDVRNNSALLGRPAGTKRMNAKH